MILPTDPSHPLFVKPGQDFREHMIRYIRANFSDTLGASAALLDRPGGLEKTLELVDNLKRKGAASCDRKAA